MLLRENSILLFFIKLLKNLESQTHISLLLELISNWIDMCLDIWKPEARVSMSSLLPGTTMISTRSTFQSCRLSISDDLQRQGKCSELYQIGQPILVPTVAADDQPGSVVFLAVTK